MRNSDNTSRRELFRRVLRFGSLGAIGVFGAAGLSKRRRLVKEGVCVGKGICCSCEVFNECGLPRAVSAKIAKGQNS